MFALAVPSPDKIAIPMQISPSGEIDVSDFVTEVSQGVMEVGKVVLGILNFFRYRCNSDIPCNTLQHLLKPLCLLTWEKLIKKIAAPS